MSDLSIDERQFVHSLTGTFSQLPVDDYDVRLAQIRMLTRCLPERSEELQRILPDYFTGRLGPAALDAAREVLAPEQVAGFERIVPFRRRAIARFAVRRGRAGRWETSELPNDVFCQLQARSGTGTDGDYRALPRQFAQLTPNITRQPIYCQFIVAIAERLAAHHPCRELLMTVHHMHCFVSTDNPAASNSPEGLHQDGSDYIVSALVVERVNVRGGVSRVYHGAKAEELVMEATLEPGQGLLHPDRGTPLWHDVTPISRADDSVEIGYRSIIGIDINFA